MLRRGSVIFVGPLRGQLEIERHEMPCVKAGMNVHEMLQAPQEKADPTSRTSEDATWSTTKTPFARRLGRRTRDLTASRRSQIRPDNPPCGAAPNSAVASRPAVTATTITVPSMLSSWSRGTAPGRRVLENIEVHGATAKPAAEPIAPSKRPLGQ